MCVTKPRPPQLATGVLISWCSGLTGPVKAQHLLPTADGQPDAQVRAGPYSGAQPEDALSTRCFLGGPFHFRYSFSTAWTCKAERNIRQG